MATRTEIELDFTSPYKRTRVFARAGKVFFGRWQPPPVVLDGDEEQIEVQFGFEGQLDLFAHAVYGDRRLWRVIAQANQIDYPLRDVVPGMRLIIPKLANVEAALAAAATSREGLDA